MKDLVNYSWPVSEVPQEYKHLNHSQKVPEGLEWDCNDQGHAQIAYQEGRGGLEYQLVSLVHELVICIVRVILSGELEPDLGPLIDVLRTVKAAEEVLVLNFSN